MSFALLFAAQTLLVPVSAGDPLLAHPDVTISEAARAAIAQGGTVTCRSPTPTLAVAVCLTGEEWRAVVKDAKLITRRGETAMELALFSMRSSIR